MATDMQSILNEIPRQGSRSTSELRDRHDEAPRTAPSKRFDAWLGSAEASRAGKAQDNLNVRHKSDSHARSSTHPNPSSGSEKDTRASASAAHEQTMRGSEGTDHHTAEVSDENQNDKVADDSHVKSQEAAAAPADMLLAGMFAQSPQGPVQADQPSESQSNSNDVAIGELPSVQTASTASADASSSSSDRTAAAVASIVAQGQPAADKTVVADDNQVATIIQATDGFTNEAGIIDVPPSTDSQDQAHAEIEAGVTDGEPKNAMLEASRTKAAAMAMEAGELEASSVDPAEAPPAFADTMQSGLSSEGQSAWNSEQSSGQERQQSADPGNGIDRSDFNAARTDDSMLRQQFMDRLTAVSQQTPPSNDSLSGGNDPGTAPMLHAAESERLTELRGASPFSQSVTLDLDPLDMGPLRLRVTMTDQIVHAHIRTEHGELGQGLLQQGPSLEASLRTTGFEMGMLRVTVDQQQGQGDHAWAFQQQQGRPAQASGPPATAGEEERAAGTDHGYHNSGRVSFFA
ncbi:MAG: putative Flagellar hook-length control protein FliK [Nitrospira sp.]|jgi:flagellar hook-length control protein FliK|nr:putative Flagellar hook-length control protein FliK [Nitrospira sp.]